MRSPPPHRAPLPPALLPLIAAPAFLPPDCRRIARPGPVLTLQQTFRFGPEIAVVVNGVLKAAYDEPDLLIGREQQTVRRRASGGFEAGQRGESWASSLAR